MKRILKWTGILIGTPMVLFLLFFALLYLPPVQKWVVDKAASYASRELGLDVTVEKVRLSFPLDLTLVNFVASQGQDTLLSAESLTAVIEPRPLFDRVVNINGLDLQNVKVNTQDWIDAVTIEGQIPHFYLYSHGINFKPEIATINEAFLDGARLNIGLNDSVPEDTVDSEPVNWHVLLEKARIKDSNLHLKIDTMNLSVGFGDAQIQQTTMDLKQSLFKVARLNLQRSNAIIDLIPGKPKQGLDYTHLQFDSLNLSVDSIVNQGTYLKMNLLKGSFKERCGLKAESLKGKVVMDSASIHLHQFALKTPFSRVDLDADVDWSSLDTKGSGLMNVGLDANLDKKDFLTAIGDNLAKDIKPLYPDVPLIAKVYIDGNMGETHIRDMQIQLEGVLDVQTDGTVFQALDNERRAGTIKMNALVGNVSPVMKLLNLNDYTIPRGTAAAGTIRMTDKRYFFDGTVEDNKGVLALNALYDTRQDSYEAEIQAKEFDVHHFMPKDSLFLFSGSVSASGTGTDFFASHTVANLKAQIEQLQYKKYDINGLAFDASLGQNLFDVHATGNNAFLQFAADASGILLKDSVGGSWDVNLKKVDLMRLGVFEKKSDLSLHFEGFGGYNYGENITIDAKANRMSIDAEKKSYKLKDLEFQGELDHDSICAHLYAGDFKAHLDTGGGLTAMMEQGEFFLDVFRNQMEAHQLHFDSLKVNLPVVHLEMESGRDNPICNFLLMKGYGYKSMHALLETSKEEGLKGNMDIYSFKSDSLQLDTIHLSIFPKENTQGFRAQVHNNRKNPQYVFNSILDGELMNDGALAHLQFFDQKNRPGVDLRVRMHMEPEGFLFTIDSEHPLIAYHNFNVTPENAYVFLRDDMQVSGNLNLLSEDGMGILFKADPEEDEQQCMNLELRKINLAEIVEVVPYMPRMTGIMNGTIHGHQPMGGKLQADGKIHFKDLVYETSPMGDIDLGMEYVPFNDDEHTISMTMERNGQLVSQFSGTYVAATGAILLDAQLIRFPAEIVNGFIPDHMFGLRGTLEGKFKLSGDTDMPVVNGTVRTDSVFIYSEMYNMNLRVQNKEFPINDSRFSMRDFTLYSEKNDELKANGTIDFTNLDKIHVNVSLQTRNFQLIDRPRNMVSQLYGKAFMNLQSTIKGDLENLVVRGTLDLLGSTDVTYVLKDSPVVVEDRLNDLVTFVDFSDTTSVQREVSKKELSGIDLQLNLNISEGARVNCDLSPNRESYVQLQGGGNLLFRYTPEGKMLLNGRYNINRGEMKYDLQVIPLKTFALGSGSYVLFDGDVMNPTLNITATEQTRASVALGGEAPRNVLFEVGVKISQSLQNMGLEFIIDALEDLAVQNELASFSKETRGKLAVSMLATGLYLSEENAQGNLSMSNALNSFLQNEISNIAGNALKSIDLSIGMEDGTAKDGSVTTDYSFRFSKHLWGNRVNIVIGGKVSTGSNVSSSDSFIDDVSIEYRLDDSGTRFVKLFHEKKFDALLDGDITETGGGVVLRKKMTKFGELLIFTSKKKREAIVQERERRREQRRQQRQQQNEENEKE